MVQTVDAVWRDFQTDGVPASGAHLPVKREIRELLGEMELAINSFLTNGGLIYATRTAMNADLAHAANEMAWVIADPVAANNMIYQKQGGSGAGSWLAIAQIPFTFVKATDAGAGTANAIIATAPLPIFQNALVAFNVFRANTATPVTVSFNGGGALTIKTATGNNPAAGGLPAGLALIGYVQGSQFRMLSDQASAAIQAAAEAAASAAEDARDLAIAAADQAAVEGAGDVPSMPSRAFAIAATIPGARTYIHIAGYATQGDGGQALYKKVGSAPSHPGKFQSADGAHWEIVTPVFNVKQFGAKGDGTTNDTTAIQNAIASAAPLNGEVYFPAGDYVAVGLVITPVVTGGILSGNVHLRGDGMRQSIIRRPVNTNGHIVQINFISSVDTLYRATQTHISALSIIGHGGSATTGSSIYCPAGASYGYAPMLEDVLLDGSPEYCVRYEAFRNFGMFTRVIGLYSAKSVLYFNNCGDFYFSNCTFGLSSNATGYDVARFDNVYSIKAHNTDFHGSYGGSALLMTGAESYGGFSGCVFNDCDQYGARLYGGGTSSDLPIVFTDCLFVDNSQQTMTAYHNILVSDRWNVAVIGCKFIPNYVTSRNPTPNRPGLHIAFTGVSGDVQFTDNVTGIPASATVGVTNLPLRLSNSGQYLDANLTQGAGGITSGTGGNPTAATGTMRSLRNGKTISCAVNVAISTNGGAGQAIRVVLPYGAPIAGSYWSGFEPTAGLLFVRVTAGVAYAEVTTASGFAYPGGDGRNMFFSFNYQIA